jgi:hypothetical protein
MSGDMKKQPKMPQSIGKVLHQMEKHLVLMPPPSDNILLEKVYSAVSTTKKGAFFRLMSYPLKKIGSGKTIIWFW